MDQKFIFPCLLFCLVSLTLPAQYSPVQMPVRFENGLIYAQVPTGAGTLSLMANTSGGAYVTEQAVRANGLATAGQQGSQFVDIGGLLAAAGWPQASEAAALVMDDRAASLAPGTDGELGQSWFGDYCWTFDYENESLLCCQYALSADGSNTMPLIFKEDEQGQRASNLPVVMANVDGTNMPFILDTGAKCDPTAMASTEMGQYSEGSMAVSFIIDFIFENWRENHPEWMVVEYADPSLGNVKLIEVPQMEIGGNVVGPVWFCSRPDANYLDYMSRFTGIPAMGSLGGNCLSYFKLSVDFQNKLAQFSLPNKG